MSRPLRARSLPLSDRDANYVRRESDRQPMNIGLLLSAAPRPGGTPVTLDLVRAHVGARIDRFPFLRWSVLRPPLGAGRLRWVDDRSFDLSDHVVRWSSDPVTDPSEALAAAAARRVDVSRALWRLEVGPPGADGRVPLLLVLHHALADGGLLTAFLDDLFAPADPCAPRADLAGDHPAAPWRPARSPSPPALLAVGIADALRRRVDERLGRGRVDVRPLEDLGRRRTGLTGELTADRRVAVVGCRLADLQRARRTTGYTINDLYLAAVTTGLRRLLAVRAGTAPTEALVALVPRDVRQPSQRLAVGNHTWSMLVHLPVHVAAAEDRLRAIAAETGRAKTADRPAGAGGKQDVSISNIRFTGEHRIGGARLGPDHACTGPLGGENRLAIVAVSYGDRFTVTFTADAAAFPDLELLAAATEEALDELCDRAAAGG